MGIPGADRPAIADHGVPEVDAGEARFSSVREKYGVIQFSQHARLEDVLIWSGRRIIALRKTLR